jgi:hypothetical protein
MNILSWIYYSFSLHVADYESKEQSLIQFTVKDKLYVFCGIVSFALRARFTANADGAAPSAPEAVANETLGISPPTASNRFQHASLEFWHCLQEINCNSFYSCGLDYSRHVIIGYYFFHNCCWHSGYDSTHSKLVSWRYRQQKYTSMRR